MNKCRFLILGICILIAPDVYARRMHQMGYQDAVWKYSPLTNEVIKGDRITDAVYRHPVVTMTHPIATAYWIEKMIKEGGFNAPQSIIYLSPYPCYQIGKIKEWQNSNWLRYVLEKGYAEKAFVVLPGYMSGEGNEYIKGKLIQDAAKIEDNLGLISSVSQLPDGKSLGDVIVVIDASYFSNQQTPGFRPDSGSIPFIVRNAVKALEAKNLNIKAVVYNTSPSFPHLGDESEIQSWLLYYLAEKGDD